MKTLLFASAFLLSPAGADGSTGGEAQADAKLSDPGIPVSETPPVPSATDVLDDLDADFARRLAAERDEAARIRALTPVQELELRPCVGASHLGIIIGTPDGIRCVSLADWRTDRICLHAGDHAQIVVLAGEGLKTWEFYRAQEARANARPELGAVKTVSLEPAQAAAILSAAAAPALETGAGAAPVDPLEQTQPVETIPAAGETKAPEAETTAAQV